MPLVAEPWDNFNLRVHFTRAGDALLNVKIGGRAADRLLLSSMSDAAAKHIWGYFSGLSSPSVTESTAIFMLFVPDRSAGWADKITDVFDKQNTVVIQRRYAARRRRSFARQDGSLYRC